MSLKHISLSIFLFIIIILGGSAGYMFLEGWNFIDAIYMTIITLTTVGFGEVHEISAPGRIYTMFLIFSGGAYFLYLGSTVIQFVVEGRIRIVLGRRILDKKIERLKDHYIICGYGRIGRVLTERLRESTHRVVVLEKNPDLIPVMEEDGVLFLSGDASSETLLLKAGIMKAKGLITALATDVDNVFLVLTARQMRSNLFILARASSQDAKSKLITAGATKVESPYSMGAESMALRILRPTVTNFLNLALSKKNDAIQIEEIPVGEESKLVNKMLKDSGIRQAYNLIIIAIKKSDGEMRFNPSFETRIKAGDTVIAVGADDSLLRLEKVLNPQNL